MSQLWRMGRTLLRLLLRRPLPGTNIVPILEDGRIILVRRRDTLQWALPGGLVDWGEDIATAVARELKEETGLDMLTKPQLVGVYSGLNRDPRMHSICITVTATVRGDFNIHDTDEIVDVAAFLLEELPVNNLAHDCANQLSDFLEGKVCLA